MTTFSTVKVDAEGRIRIPKNMRERLGIQPGDTLFVGYAEGRQVMRLAKAENPFDVLVEHALAERKAGRTRNLRKFAAEIDIALAVGP